MHNDLARTLSALSRSVTPSTVHAARTSSRRLRAILSGYRKFLRPVARRRYVATLEEVTRKLDALRDADVMQKAMVLSSQRDYSLDGEFNGLSRLMSRNRLHKLLDLKTDIESESWTSRMTRLQRSASGPLLLVERERAELSILSHVLHRERRRLRAALRYRGHGSRSLHRLRSKIRRMRYLLEHAQSLRVTGLGPEIERLHKLQDCLGSVHDGWVLNRTLKKQRLYPQAVAALSSVRKRHRQRLLVTYHKQRTALLHAWRKGLKRE
jgi:CHAD domain-containing protein